MCSLCAIRNVLITYILWFVYAEIIFYDKRLFWKDSYFEKRDRFGFDKFILPNILNSQRVNFNKVFRMSYGTFRSICNQLDVILSTNRQSFRTDRLSVSEKVAVTLRFYATGDSYTSLETLFHIASNTICDVISHVTSAILKKLGPIHLQPPRTRERWLQISDQFAEDWQFPHCLGAIDGKHIAIPQPAHTGSEYFNYHQFFSVVLLGIAGPDYKFLWAETGVNGKISDGGVWSRSDFKTKLLDTGKLNIPTDRNFPYFFVGDGAFPVSDYLLTPFRTIVSWIQNNFNNRLSRARRIIENCFGLLVARFRCLSRTLNLQPDKAKNVVQACVILHNMLRDEIEPEDVDRQRNGRMVEGRWRRMQNELNFIELRRSTAAGNHTSNGTKLRERVANYLASSHEQQAFRNDMARIYS